LTFDDIYRHVTAGRATSTSSACGDKDLWVPVPQIMLPGSNEIKKKKSENGFFFLLFYKVGLSGKCDERVISIKFNATSANL
jgi:hypothetical protein